MSGKGGATSASPIFNGNSRGPGRIVLKQSLSWCGLCPAIAYEDPPRGRRAVAGRRTNNRAILL
jgi:hypothetical protein